MGPQILARNAIQGLVPLSGSQPFPIRLEPASYRFGRELFHAWIGFSFPAATFAL